MLYVGPFNEPANVTLACPRQFDRGTESTPAQSAAVREITPGAWAKGELDLDRHQWKSSCLGPSSTSLVTKQ